MNRSELIQASLGLGGNKEGTELGSEKIVSDLDLTSSKSVENKRNRTDKPVDAKNEKQISEFCQKLSRGVSGVVNENKLPVILGGDHSISIGSMSGTSSATESAGVLWIDAHADFNTPETSPSGSIHGMPVATALGRGRFDWGSTDLLYLI
jgi:arginase